MPIPLSKLAAVGATARPPVGLVYERLIDSLTPTYFWPFQTDAVSTATALTLTTPHSAPTYTLAGPGMVTSDTSMENATVLHMNDAGNVINANTNTTGYSYGGWFRVDVLQSDKALISNWGASKGFMIHEQTSASWLIYHQGTGHSAGDVFTDQGWSVGEWHHWFVTWDGTTVRLYLDGVLSSSWADSTALGSITDFHVGSYANRTGSRPDAGAAWCGLWENVCLTPAQVAKLAGLSPYEQLIASLEPTHFWKLDGDLTSWVGGNSLSSIGTAPTYTTGPGQIAEGQSATSASLCLTDTSINFNANTTGYSYAGWLLIDSFSTDRGVMGNWSTGGSMLYMTNGGVDLRIYHEGTTTQYAHGLSTGTWYHFCVTTDMTGSGEQILYVDGVNVLSQTGTTAAASSILKLQITGYNGNTRKLSGDAAYFGWWENTVLTPAQVAALAGV